MRSGADSFTITIRKRPWWFWALAGIWLLLEALLLQTAVASVQEGEYRAATINWIVVGLLAAFGCIAWLRRGRPPRAAKSSEQSQEHSTSRPANISTVA
jgi:hypothetical protein